MRVRALALRPVRVRARGRVRRVARSVLAEGPPAADTGQVDDAELEQALAAARAGDQHGLTVLYRALHPGLLRYLRHRLPSAAEDVASETWLAAAAGLPGLSGGVPELRAWLFGIARHKVADHVRRLGRSPQTVPFGDLDRAADDDPAGAAVAAADADRAVAALVGELTAEQAEVVLLRVVGGLSVEQVARLTGRSVGSVRVVQHRALRRLARSTRMAALRPEAAP